MDSSETSSPRSPKESDYQSSVDTSRPFRSVKEAVAVFGERILVGSAYVSPARDTWKPVPPSPNKKTTIKSKNDISEALKKVEAELEETKAELKALRETESETEAAVASLASRLAQTEEEERKRELRKRMEKNTTLAQIMSLGLGKSDVTLSDRFGKRNYKKIKVKPIVPLVGDYLFAWKKKSSTSSSSSSTNNTTTSLHNNHLQLYH